MLIRKKKLIKLFKYLSKLKYLYLIEINFYGKLVLDKKYEKKIYELFPDITIKITDEGSSIIWENNKPILKIDN